MTDIREHTTIKLYTTIRQIRNTFQHYSEFERQDLMNDEDFTAKVYELDRYIYTQGGRTQLPVRPTGAAFVAEVPGSYDPDTESKVGGMIAATLLFQEQYQGRTRYRIYAAVDSSIRRHGIGSFMLRTIRDSGIGVVADLGSGGSAWLATLVNVGFYPSSVIEMQ